MGVGGYMSYKEIKKLLNELNCENVEAIKPQIIRKMNQLILSINDDNISDSELEEISNLIIVGKNLGKRQGKITMGFMKVYL
jgi:hypothetical protein